MYQEPLPTSRQAKISFQFQRQVAFATGYSPLYAHLFGLLGEWLDSDEPFRTWLLHTTAELQSFNVSLLMAAGVHKIVLEQRSALSAYYPSTGGSQPFAAPGFATALYDTIMQNRAELAAFIQTSQIQTNETGRGLIWLLPLATIGWPNAHLVDLGASAGLNLMAEQRRYTCVAPDGSAQLTLGTAPSPQFTVQLHEDGVPLVLTDVQAPNILSRTGCDLEPFLLNTPEQAATLSAFIWPDQPQRIDRLREGIAAFHATNKGEATIDLHAVNLPSELPAFLQQLSAQLPADGEPLILYNTFMTVYLDDRGESLGAMIGAWAKTQIRPILHLQWEPDYKNKEARDDALLYSADYYHNGNHTTYDLGWVHPHGTMLQLKADWLDFRQIGERSRK